MGQQPVLEMEMHPKPPMPPADENPGREVRDGGFPRAETQLVPVQPTDMGAMLVRLASDPAVDVAKLEKLIDMHERVLAREAEAAFNAAFAVMQGEIPTIGESASTDKGTYSPLEDIIEVVRPILKAHGFSLSFQTSWPEGKKVKVTGILTHRDGHARTSEFIGDADTSGSKNAIQAQGSTVTYGRRYTTKDLLCIVTRDEDDDGETSEQHKQPEGPNGYDEFIVKLEALSKQGTAPMFRFWNESAALLRQHCTRHDRKRWEALKAVAAGVK